MDHCPDASYILNPSAIIYIMSLSFSLLPSPPGAPHPPLTTVASVMPVCKRGARVDKTAAHTQRVTRKSDTKTIGAVAQVSETEAPKRARARIISLSSHVLLRHILYLFFFFPFFRLSPTYPLCHHLSSPHLLIFSLISFPIPLSAPRWTRFYSDAP